MVARTCCFLLLVCCIPFLEVSSRPLTADPRQPTEGQTSIKAAPSNHAPGDRKDGVDDSGNAEKKGAEAQVNKFGGHRPSRHKEALFNDNGDHEKYTRGQTSMKAAPSNHAPGDRKGRVDDSGNAEKKGAEAQVNKFWGSPSISSQRSPI